MRVDSLQLESLNMLYNNWMNDNKGNNQTGIFPLKLRPIWICLSLNEKYKSKIWFKWLRSAS